MAELRTMFVFEAVEGEDWPHLFERLADKLRERDPDEFIQASEQHGPAPAGPEMRFGITLLDEGFDGIARPSPAGVALLDATARHAAQFADWLCGNVVPTGATTKFNTEWGIEEDLPFATVPVASTEDLTQLFLDHLVATGALDDE